MIRRATTDDFDTLIALGRQMHAESWYAYLPFEEAKVRRVLDALIPLDDGYVMVYERAGVIEGGMVGVIAELWFCHARCASDLALFIRPGARGGMVAARLVADFIAWADARDVSEKSLSVSTGVQKEATGRLFEHFGLTHVGGIFKQQGAACAKG